MEMSDRAEMLSVLQHLPVMDMEHIITQVPQTLNPKPLIL